MRTGLLNSRRQSARKNLLPHGINDNLLISHLSYLGAYQDEDKNESSTKRQFNWVGTKPDKNRQNCGARYSYKNQHMKN